MIYNSDNKEKLDELRKKMVTNARKMFDAHIELTDQLMAMAVKELEHIAEKNKKDIENYLDEKFLPF